MLRTANFFSVAKKKSFRERTRVSICFEQLQGPCCNCNGALKWTRDFGDAKQGSRACRLSRGARFCDTGDPIACKEVYIIRVLQKMKLDRQV